MWFLTAKLINEKKNEEKERYESALMWFLTKIEAFVFEN